MTIALGKFTKDENDLFDIMDEKCILFIITLLWVVSIYFFMTLQVLFYLCMET